MKKLKIYEVAYINPVKVRDLKAYCKSRDLNYYAVCDARYKAKVKAKKKGEELKEFFYKNLKFEVK